MAVGVARSENKGCTGKRRQAVATEQVALFRLSVSYFHDSEQTLLSKKGDTRFKSATSENLVSVPFQFFLDFSRRPKIQNVFRRNILCNFERSFHVKISE